MAQRQANSAEAVAAAKSEAEWNVIKLDSLSISLAAGFVYYGYHYLPIPTPTAVTHLSEHLLYALKWQLPSVLLIAWAVINVIMKRLEFTAYDPLKQPDTKSAAEILEVHRRFLSNTVEQYVINGPALLMLSLYLAPHQLKVIPLLVAVFFVGRVAFLYGYLSPQKARTNRGFGFAITLLPSVIVLFYVTWCFVCEFLAAL